MSLAEQSELVKIVKRLEAMQDDRSRNRQSRTFTMFGVAVCDVTYLHDEGIFILVQLDNSERYRFDKLDLAAIEIYRCLYDYQESF